MYGAVFGNLIGKSTRPSIPLPPFFSPFHCPAHTIVKHNKRQTEDARSGLYNTHRFSHVALQFNVRQKDHSSNSKVYCLTRFSSFNTVLVKSTLFFESFLIATQLPYKEITKESLTALHKNVVYTITVYKSMNLIHI